MDLVLGSGPCEKGEDEETNKMKESPKTTFGVSMPLLSYFAFTKLFSSNK